MHAVIIALGDPSAQFFTNSPGTGGAMFSYCKLGLRRREERMLADLRDALRQLRKAPGFTTTAIITLALGIGATTAIFTLIHQVMLKSLPVAKPEELWRIGDKIRCCNWGGYTQGDDGNFSSVLVGGIQDLSRAHAGVHRPGRAASRQCAAWRPQSRVTGGRRYAQRGVGLREFLQNPGRAAVDWPAHDRRGRSGRRAVRWR